MAYMRKAIGVIIALVIVAELFLSCTFISRNAHHHCYGENCHTCEQIAVAKSILKKLSVAICFVAIAASLCILARAGKQETSGFVPTITPFTLKVKMLN